jgi:hypothetical protein
MSYMLLIVEPTDQRAERTLEEGQALYARMVEFAGTLQARGVLRGVESLERSERATRAGARRRHAPDRRPVRRGEGNDRRLFLVDVDTRDEAIEIARQCPAAQWCTVEVRAVGPCFCDERRVGIYPDSACNTSIRPRAARRRVKAPMNGCLFHR